MKGIQYKIYKCIESGCKNSPHIKSDDVNSVSYALFLKNSPSWRVS